MKRLYKEFCEFTDRLKNQQGYVNLLIELSPKLLESSVRYGNQIAYWSNKVETRYKEFFNVLSKVQQANGLQTLNNDINNSTPSLSSQTTTSESSAFSSSFAGSLNNSTSLLNSPTVSSSGYESNFSKTSMASTETLSASSSKITCDNDNKKKQDMLKKNEQKQKLIKKRQNIITEIIQTEKSYCQDLRACLESYFKEFTQNTQSQPEYLRGKEAIIFGNLEEIYNFHRK